MKFETLRLKPGKEKALGRRHPWIFSGALTRIPDHLKDGQLVQVLDNQGQFQASGFFRPGSIAVLVVSFLDTPDFGKYIEEQLTKAIAYREKLGLLTSAHTNCYRLVYGEGDQLPGLIIDRYAETAVIQTHHPGWLPFLEVISNHLLKQVKYVFHRPADKVSGVESSWLTARPELYEVLENGHRFKIDLEEGQKTGFFLDQRENRKKLAEYASGKTVLNTFSYSGGFSVYALAAGARKVVSVDISESAIELARVNVQLNGFDERHEAVSSDVLQFLKTEGGSFDIIILDPPAFSKSRRTIHKAVQAYKRLNAKAISEIKTGGLLFSFSCSQHMSPQLFEDTLRAAAIETGRPVRIVERLGQPADHPTNIYHPEGTYLKGLILEVT